jgi:hypothetical protein
VVILVHIIYWKRNVVTFERLFNDVLEYLRFTHRERCWRHSTVTNKINRCLVRRPEEQKRNVACELDLSVCPRCLRDACGCCCSLQPHVLWRRRQDLRAGTASTSRGPHAVCVPSHLPGGGWWHGGPRPGTPHSLALCSCQRLHPLNGGVKFKCVPLLN